MFNKVNNNNLLGALKKAPALNNFKNLVALGLILVLESCGTYMTLKGFDKIKTNKIPQTEIPPAEEYRAPLEDGRINNFSVGKDGTIVLEYEMRGGTTTDLMFIYKGKQYILKTAGYDIEPHIQGNSVVYTGSGETGNDNIYVLNIDDFPKLTKGDVTQDTLGNRGGSTNKDGTTFSYTRGEQVNGEVYAIDTRTGEKTNVRINVSDHKLGDYYPVMSGNGEKVAFVSERKGLSSVLVKDIKTGELITVAQSDVMQFHDLKFNHDGTKLVYVGVIPGIRKGTVFYKDLEEYGIKSFPLKDGKLGGKPSITWAGDYIVYGDKSLDKYVRRNIPNQTTAIKKAMPTAQLDEDGNVKVSKTGNVETEKKKSEYEIVVVNIKTGKTATIKGQIPESQEGSYVFTISRDGKYIRIINQQNKDNGYRILNPVYEEPIEEEEPKEKDKPRYKRKSLLGDPK